MKNLLITIEESLAEAALLEMGIYPENSLAILPKNRGTVEENLIEAAFAEAADYEQIHRAILREKRKAANTDRTDDCKHDDHDLCAA